MQPDQIGGRHIGVRVRPQDDPGLFEKIADLACRVRPEELEWRGLLRHECQLDVGAHVVGTLGRHEGQLVERQRPRNAKGDDEGDSFHVAGLDVLDQPVHALLGTRRAEGQRALIGNVLDAADGEEEGVVCECLAIAGANFSCSRIDRVDGSSTQHRVGISSETSQGIAGAAGSGERGQDGHRQMHALLVRRDERRLDERTGELSQDERRLDPRRAATADDDLESTHDRRLGRPRARLVSERAAAAAAWASNSAS
jgi:hypothetical protein